jgi:FixJ family two-component response regulator
MTVPAVFVINTNATLCELVASVARRAGCQVHYFSDVNAYLSHPVSHVVSCLVADMELCGSDLNTFAARCPETPVIFTAKEPTLRAVVLAMKAGAIEFLAEPVDEELFLSAIRTAFDLSNAALSRQADLHMLSARYACLSQREREVMSAVIAGRLNKQIAYALGVAEVTVKKHRGRVMRKMRAASLPELVNLATRLRWLPGPSRPVTATQITAQLPYQSSIHQSPRANDHQPRGERY